MARVLIRYERFINIGVLTVSYWLKMTMIFKQSNTFGIKREQAARERKTRIEVIL